ncbi:MAG: class A beta-lactamase-related serine hydrolase [Betaproteobacteria bacterium]|nr:MAG: class A beta-lactamase-related serine hydrolase [Betaproteobacteria bacterium]
MVTRHRGAETVFALTFHRNMSLRILRNLNLILIVAVLLAGCSLLPRQSAQRIDSVIAGEMAKQRVPGLAVGVVQRGEVIRAAGFGLANVEHAVPVKNTTVFQSGSLAKQFTAVAVMLQVEDGKLALDDSIAQYLPEAPVTWQPITVRHLLTHTSGIPNYDESTLDYRKDYTEEELARVAFGRPLEFSAGSRWNYSDTGYMLLGAIVRKASGQFYGDVLRDRVFAPLGMTTARVISEEDIVINRASGYRLVGEALKNQEWVAPKLNTTADGSLYLSLQDWLIWEQVLRKRAVLRTTSWEQVFAPVRLNSGKTYPYGLGWEFNDEGQGPAWYRHSGSWQGFHAAYLHAIDADMSVIVLANLADANPMRVAERVAQIFLPDLMRPLPLQPLEQDPKLAQRVRGLLEATMAGSLNESEFEFLPASFFPTTPAAYKTLLAGLGRVEHVELLDRQQRGDDTILGFRAIVGSQPFLVNLSVTPAGRFSSYGLRLEGRSE